MSTITLHRHALSGHSHRVELFLSILGLDADIIDVDLGSGEHKKAAFLQKNSFGQLPVLPVCHCCMLCKRRVTPTHVLMVQWCLLLLLLAIVVRSHPHKSDPILDARNRSARRDQVSNWVCKLHLHQNKNK